MAGHWMWKEPNVDPKREGVRKGSDKLMRGGKEKKESSFDEVRATSNRRWVGSVKADWEGQGTVRYRE